MRLILVLLLVAPAGFAQTSECATKDTRGDAIRCYQAEMKQVDSAMQAALDHLLAFFAPSEKNLAGLKGETSAKQKQWYERMQQQLEASQTAFLAYRDQTCAIFDVEYAEGTMRPVAVLDCRVKLTKARAQWLRDTFQEEGD
jgi:uncharacterized protein YecT (DUF1311 family)